MADGGLRILITAGFVHAAADFCVAAIWSVSLGTSVVRRLPSNIDLHDLNQSDAVLAGRIPPMVSRPLLIGGSKPRSDVYLKPSASRAATAAGALLVD